LKLSKSSESSEHFDLTYSNEPASGYVLILELDDHHLKACWYHQSKRLITGFAEYNLQGGSFPSALSSLLQSHSFLKSEFQQTIISFRNANYSIIPRSTDDLKNHDWFELGNEINDETEVLLEHNLVNLRSKVLFAIDSEIESSLKFSFLNTIIIPHIAPLVESGMNEVQHSISQAKMIVHLSKDHLDIIIFKDTKLHLCNSFYHSGKEDIAYYILYAAEVVSIDPDKVILELSGTIVIGDENWTMLSNYWKSISIAKPVSEIQISEKLTPYNLGSFDYLTQSLLCAS
jgi:hypothetical protein